MFCIAVLNKHLTPTPEEFHRCNYVCIIMVLPVKGFIEKGFFSRGEGGLKKKGRSNLSAACTAISHHHHS